MGYVRVKPGVGREVAERFGATVTRRHALVVAGKAKALADARAKRSSVADRIDVTVRPGAAQDTRVLLSVIGRNGEQIAAHLEFGYFNKWAQRRLAGLHIMRDAAFGG